MISCPGCEETDILVEAGVDTSRIVNTNDLIDSFSLLSTGRSDVSIAQMSSFAALMKKIPDATENFELVGPLPDVDINCSGMGFRIADSGLRDAYNAGLKKIQESGEFDQILESYELLPELTYMMSTEQLCGM